MKLTLLDTVTGKTLDIEDDFEGIDYWWADGNGACDCNRALRMLSDGEYEEYSTDKEEGVCDRCHRFLIIKTDSQKYSIGEFNHAYPLELLKRFGIPQCHTSLKG